jgi:hypothetical protein
VAESTPEQSTGDGETPPDMLADLSLADKAIVLGKLMLQLGSETVAIDALADATAPGNCSAARRLLESDPTVHPFVQQPHPVLDEIVQRIMAGHARPEAATIDFDESYIKPLDSMITGATGGRYGSLDQLLDAQTAVLRGKVSDAARELATLRSHAEAQSARLDAQAAVMEQMKRQLARAVVGPSTGESGELTFEVVMQKAGSLFRTADDRALVFDLADVEVPIFRWRDAAGAAVPHPAVPLIDPFYVWRPEVVDTILFGLVNNRPVWLTGDTATGKSTAFEQACAVLNWPCLRLNLDSDISRIDLIGRDTLKNGTSTFIDGPLPIAVASPTVLVCDEIDFARPEILYALQRALEGKGVLIPEDGGRVVAPHP